MFVSLVFIVAGLAGLVIGAESLIRGSCSAGLRAGVKPLVVGLTCVTFGTSTPELIIVLQGTLQGRGDLAAATLLGSNVFNMTLVLGLAACITPVRAQRMLVRLDLPILAASAVLIAGLFWDQRLDRKDGVVLFSLFVLYGYANFLLSRGVPLAESERALQKRYERRIRERSSASARRGWIKDVALIGIGGGVLFFSAQLLLSGVLDLGRSFGVSEAWIGWIVLAAGTSLPELTVAMIAAHRRQSDLVLGNLIGSGVLNLLGVLGTASLLVPVHAPRLAHLDLIVLVGTHVLLLPLMGRKMRLGRVEGALLVFVYLTYIYQRAMRG
jgi:cation:H+ antiporter